MNLILSLDSHGNPQKWVTWKKAMNGSYRSKLAPASLVASILTWNIRYNCPIWFTTKENTGEIIYYLLKYNYMEILKNIEIDVDME